MLLMPGFVTLGLDPYLPAVLLLIPATLGAGAYFCLGSTDSIGVGSHASFSPGVIGLSPLNDPSGLRALLRWGLGLLLLSAILLFLHLVH